MRDIYFEKDIGFDAKAIGKAVWETTIKVLLSAPKDIIDSKLPCCHVSYDELVRDPVSTIRKIYTFFGWTYSPEYDTLLKEYIEQDKLNRIEESKNGKMTHRYKLEDFGLTKEQIYKDTTV